VRDLPRKAQAYLLVLSLAAGGLLGVLAWKYSLPEAFVGFGILFLLADLAPVRMREATYSVSYLIGVAALVSLGPSAAAAAAALGGLADLARQHSGSRAPKTIFNTAQLTFTTGVSGLIYVLLKGPVGSLRASDFPAVLFVIAITAVAHFLINALLVATMISCVRKLPLRDVLHANYSSIVWSTISFAFVGLILGGLYEIVGLWASLFVLVPLLIARATLQAASRMNEAYESTLRALVTAIEAKDAYTRGHAERVSKLTTMIARELHFSEKEIHNIRIAALMHDVGKLVVSTAILTKPGKLTDEEYEHMKWHPIFGCEVIEEIDFLRQGEAVNAVRHHHERLDGRGYPDNLFGDDVPITARVVMVADAFDSMTSTRTYRFAKSVDDGLRELRRCAATQFDPLCISALDRAIRKHGWEPTPELYEGEKTERPAVSVHAQHA
jgi:HD-GYP domain-containing protein (c-di-GMP phosphodiesterase class II)